jgi:hypothetical protein
MVSLRDSDDEDTPFKLRCENCDSSCQLPNPAKWKKDHNCPGDREKAEGSTALKVKGVQCLF